MLKAYLILKKIVYFYGIATAIILLVALASSIAGSETDAGFFFGMAFGALMVFLIPTSPVCLVALLLLVFSKPLKQILTQAERFHSGHH